MVICFFWEMQLSVAPKDAHRSSIFFFSHSHLLALSVNKSPQFLFPYACSAMSKEKTDVSEQASLFLVKCTVYRVCRSPM